MKRKNILLCAVAMLVGSTLTGIGILRYKNKKEKMLGFDDDFDEEESIFDDEGNLLDDDEESIFDEKLSEEDEDKKIEDLALRAVDFLLEDAIKRDKENKSLEEMKEDIKRNTDEITSLWEHIEALYKKDSIKKEDIKKDRG